MAFGGVGAAVVGGIGVAAKAGAGIAQGLQAGSDQRKADAAAAQAAQYRQNASDLWQDLQMPPQDTSNLMFQTWLQNYNPVAYEPYIGQVTQMHDDQASLDAQNQALAQLQALAKGGLQPADIVALQQIQQQQAAAESAAANQVQAQLQARGLGGSGAELAGRLAANQVAANNANQNYNAALQAAMTRQINAINNAGTLAGNIRGESGTISKNMADIANTFNTQVQKLRTDAAQNAAQIQNEAQKFNELGQQTVANNNVATANNNLQYHNNLAQTMFNDQVQKTQGAAGAIGQQATQSNAESAAYAQRAASDQQALNSGLSSLGDLANIGTKAYNQYTADNTGASGNINSSSYYDPANYGYTAGGAGTQSLTDLGLYRRLGS
jgi:hypothetical protein